MRVAENNFRRTVIFRDRAGGANVARCRKLADALLVLAPNQDGEYLVRVRLIQIDEGGGTVTARCGVFSSYLPAYGLLLSNVLCGLFRRDGLRRASCPTGQQNRCSDQAFHRVPLPSTRILLCRLLCCLPLFGPTQTLCGCDSFACLCAHGSLLRW